MRQAQVTMFMIVGLVLIVLAVGTLFLVASAQEATPILVVEERNVNAQTCLERPTRLSLEGIQEQGVLTMTRSCLARLNKTISTRRSIYKSNLP